MKHHGREYRILNEIPNCISHRTVEDGVLRVLILSFYYHPDLCAGSFRCSALVEQLRVLMDKDTEIDVITTLPNRYSEFNAEAPELEQEPGLRIQRISLPAHRSGMLDQAKAFAHFSLEVNKRIKKENYDLVFATSSRLMTAALGAWVARRKKAKLYLDIRDIFVDTIQDVLPSKISFLMKPIFSFIEKWTVLRAQRVNLVSKGFEDYFNKRYPKAELRWFTNGIDPEFIDSGNGITYRGIDSSRPLTVLYAGNIGEGQGLHAIIPVLAKRMETRVHFKVIGDGGRKAQLQAALSEAQCKNVEVLPPMTRPRLLAEYQQADVLFLHLNDYQAFLKVLPSKIFEYAALGKPIWAGISGYSAEFVKTEVSNAAIFHPCNALQAEEVFSNLIIGNEARQDFIKKYQRQTIMQTMVADMLALV